MNFLPITCFCILNMLIILGGYVLQKKSKIWQSWVMFIVSIGLVNFFFCNENPVIRMFAIITTAFTGMKVITTAVLYKDKSPLAFRPWLFFVIAWAGMRAEPFEKLGGKSLSDAGKMVTFGLKRILAGAIMITIAHMLVLLPLDPFLIYVSVTVLILIAFSLILHFGVLPVSGGIWRFFGVDAYYLFKEPLKSASLAEFWSKRWNIAFSEMTSVAVYRPLQNKIGKGAALIASFAFSGLLHELALSVPVRSGYGLPFLYFIIQGSAVLFENMLRQKNSLIFKNRLIARIWTLCWIVLPVPLLFHDQFIKQIIWPLAGIKM